MGVLDLGGELTAQLKGRLGFVYNRVVDLVGAGLRDDGGVNDDRLQPVLFGTRQGRYAKPVAGTQDLNQSLGAFRADLIQPDLAAMDEMDMGRCVIWFIDDRSRGHIGAASANCRIIKNLRKR